jgi:3-hydroxyisobutyrate dehydrogenase-like beta-hydroxyacid dehydrogenase
VITPSSNIALLGFGPLGRMLGRALAQRGCAVSAYDTVSATEIETAGIFAAPSLAEALRGAKLVIVTSGVQPTTDFMLAATALLVRGQVYLDLRSAMPLQQQLAAVLKTLGFDIQADTTGIDLASTPALRGELP